MIILRTLSGNSSSNCMTDVDLASGTVAGLGVICVGDYQEYLDSNNQCNDNTKFLTYVSAAAVCTSKF